MINQATLDLIKNFEGLSLDAYPDPFSSLGKLCTVHELKLTDYRKVPNWKEYRGDPWTIGYGDTKLIFPGMRITAAKAEKMLLQRIGEFESAVQDICKSAKFSPNSNQYGAMVSFAFNLGPHTLQDVVKETHLNGYNRSSWDTFTAKMLEYDHSDGEVEEGLKRRRQAEVELFRKPV